MKKKFIFLLVLIAVLSPATGSNYSTYARILTAAGIYAPILFSKLPAEYNTPLSRPDDNKLSQLLERIQTHNSAHTVTRIRMGLKTHTIHPAIIKSMLEFSQDNLLKRDIVLQEFNRILYEFHLAYCDNQETLDIFIAYLRNQPDEELLHEICRLMLVKLATNKHTDCRKKIRRFMQKLAQSDTNIRQILIQNIEHTVNNKAKIFARLFAGTAPGKAIASLIGKSYGEYKIKLLSSFINIYLSQTDDDSYTEIYEFLVTWHPRWWTHPMFGTMFTEIYKTENSILIEQITELSKFYFSDNFKHS